MEKGIMHASFKAISLSYKKAPVEIREIMSLDETVIHRILSGIRDLLPINDLLILSTCNRTEIYYVGEKDFSDELIRLIGVEKGIHDISAYKSFFNILTNGGEAIRHLFRVSMGLEAQVVGDMQISNQVKKAYQWSADANLAGPFLHRLMHTIFFASKRVVQETSFRDGAASVSYAASELIQGLAQNFVDARVLVLGLGEIGSDVCKHLSDSELDVTICNRTLEKAKELAEACSLNMTPFERVDEALESADIIISSIAHDQPFITKQQVSRFNIKGYKYFIDLSVPRSVEEEVSEVHGAVTYNIDNVQSKATEALHKRMASVPQVERIIEEATKEFSSWSKEMEVSPTIQKLKKALENIRQEELTRHLKNASEDQSQMVDKVTKSMMQKIMKLPVLQLKAACKRGEAETLIDVLNDLFDLEKKAEADRY